MVAKRVSVDAGKFRLNLEKTLFGRDVFRRGSYRDLRVVGVWFSGFTFDIDFLKIVLGDEMLTPDSSRFWPADGYEKGKGQPSFDKQFARDWLKSDENKNAPEDWFLPQEIVDKTIDKYLSAYRMLTGEEL